LWDSVVFSPSDGLRNVADDIAFVERSRTINKTTPLMIFNSISVKEERDWCTYCEGGSGPDGVN